MTASWFAAIACPTSLVRPADEIDVKLVGKNDKVPPGMTVAFGILGNQLLDSRDRHGDGPFPFALLELYGLIKCTFERLLEVQA